MRILDEDFRKLDKKWIAINREKDIKKINKILKLKLENAITLAYIYIDHNKGLCARLAGNVFHENKELFIDDEFVTNEIVIYSDILKKFKFVFVDNNTTKNILNLDVIEKEIEAKFYNKLSILEARNLKLIDEFRHEIYPDDLELYFEQNKKSELIWGRVEVYSKDKNILACKLLNDSKINNQYKKDCYVFVKIIQNKKDINIVIDKLADIKSK